jgi:hypothetical protein
MAARPARSTLRSFSTTVRLLLAGSAALTLITMPAGFSVNDAQLGLAWQTALAKNDGGGQGNGGGHGGGNGGGHGVGNGGGRGGGHGQAGQAHGRGHGSGNGSGVGPDTKAYDSMDQFMGEAGNGHAFGRGRHDARTDEAKGRYRDALESPGHRRKQVPAGFTKHHGPDLDRGPAYGLAPDETKP